MHAKRVFRGLVRRKQLGINQLALRNPISSKGTSCASPRRDFNF